MKYFIYFYLFLFAIGCGTISAEKKGSYPYRSEKKWGVHDEKGKIILGPIFDTISAFNDGRAVFWQDGSCGYIDEQGKLLTKNKYNYCYCFREGVAKVMKRLKGKDELLEIVDVKGNTLFSSHVDSFSSESKEGLFLSMADTEESNMRYMDKYGKIKIYTRYSHSRPFSEGLAYLWDDNRGAYIDKNGIEVLQLPKMGDDDASDGLIQIVQDSMALFLSINDINLKKPVLSFSTVSKVYFDFVNGFARVFDMEARKYGFIDKQGHVITDCAFTDAHDFSGGLAAVALNGKWGFIDKSGKIKITPIYDKILCDFDTRLAQIVLGKEIYWIGKKGNKIIPH